MRGFRLIGRLVKLHPMPFALSLVGGVGWAALVVGTSYVLGRVTDEVIDPAFTTGVEAGTVWWAVAALILVAVLRGLSVMVRRWFGSLTEARMQVSLRSSVVDRLLVMPLRSYRARPTGELLANADVDVLTTTQMLMPLPFSLGVVALAVISLISLFLADWTFALVALLLFPALAVPQPLLHQPGPPARGAGAGAPRRGVGHRARELRRRAGRQDARSRGRGERSGSPTPPTASGPNASGWRG